MRRAFAISVLPILLVTACSSSAKTDQAAPTTTSTPATAQSTLATAPATSPASPVTISAFVRAVDLKKHTITVDPMAFLTGEAAVTAFQHANPGETEGPPNDYYIQNPQKDRVELKFPPQAIVQLVHVPESSGKTHPVPVPQARLVGYEPLSFAPFVITARAGTVQSVVETYVP